MKFIICIFVLVNIFIPIAICSDVNLLTLREPSEAANHQFVEIIRNDILKELPSFDPIEFDRIEFRYPGEMFGANVNVSKGSISGLSDYRILELDFSKTEPAFTFQILFPFFKLYAEHYELDGHIYYAVPMKGEGVAHFEVYNLQIKGTIYLQESEISNIDKLENAELNVERIVSYTEFDRNIDKIISAMVEDMLAGYINRFNKYILITYSDTIVEYINDIIKSLE